MMKPAVTVDVRRIACPPGLWVLVPALRDGEIGDVVEVLTTDPKDKDDIATWVKKVGHEILYVIREQDYDRIAVRKTR